MKDPHKRLSAEEIAQKIRTMIMANPKLNILGKEGLAYQFSVKEHEVHQALHLLNLEGLVSQAEHRIPTDKFWGKGSMWQGDNYYVRREDS